MSIRANIKYSSVLLLPYFSIVFFTYPLITCTRQLTFGALFLILEMMFDDNHFVTVFLRNLFGLGLSKVDFELYLLIIGRPTAGFTAYR